MKRRNFLKLFGIGTASMAVPAFSKPEKNNEFTFEDTFLRHDGNGNLYYIKKDSLLNQELMKAIGENYLPTDKFGCYYPVSNQYVPIKEKYTIDDFRQLIMLLEDKRGKFDYFCDGKYKDYETGLIRLIKYRNSKFYRIDLFQAFKNGQYGS